MTAWQAVGNVPPRELTDARLKLHWAAQLVGAVGAALVPKNPDDSHTALEWLKERAMLCGRPTKPRGARRAALALRDLRIVLLDGALEELDALPLVGKTLEDGLDWLSGAFDAELELPDYEMPAHEVAAGSAFTLPRPGAFEEIASWYGNASAELERYDAPVLCWPHHFDIAVLITVAPEKTIGIGLSPGDESYEEPYWYVTPWPYPAPGERPPLPMGHWHDEGFVAAILPGSKLTEHEDGEAQRLEVEAFLDAAVSGARKLLAGDP